MAWPGAGLAARAQPGQNSPIHFSGHKPRSNSVLSLHFWRRRSAKEQTCLSCGFLSLNGGELLPVERRILAGDPVSVRVNNLERTNCWRHQWADLDSAHHNSDRAIIEIFALVVEARDKCPYYIRHEPGLAPSTHAEVDEDRKRAALQWKITWAGAFAGFVAALLVEAAKYVVRHWP